MLIKVLIDSAPFFGVGWIMGFLRFLGKNKQKGADELDVPPSPPSSLDFGDFENDLATPLPGDEMTSELSAYPRPQAMGKDEFPSFDDLKFPEDDQGDAIPMSLPTPEQKFPSFSSQPPVQLQHEVMPRAQAKQSHGPTYIRVQDYQKMMGDLTLIRSDLRKAGQGLSEMMTTVSGREKDYSRYRNMLIDIQKKLVFMDKTLFKGEAK